MSAIPRIPPRRLRCHLTPCPRRTVAPAQSIPPSTTSLTLWYISHKPTVCLGVTSAVADTYGHDDGRIEPTRCALIGAVLGDRCRRCCVCRTPPAAARSDRSALAATSKLVSTAAPDGFHRARTTRRLGLTPCDDASPPMCAPDTCPCPLHPCLLTGCEFSAAQELLVVAKVEGSSSIREWWDQKNAQDSGAQPDTKRR